MNAMGAAPGVAGAIAVGAIAASANMFCDGASCWGKPQGCTAAAIQCGWATWWCMTGGGCTVVGAKRPLTGQTSRGGGAGDGGGCRFSTAAAAAADVLDCWCGCPAG